LISLGIYAYYQYNRTNKTLVKIKPDFIVTAESVIKEFSDHETDANKKYLGKILLVNGMVKRVEKDDKGYYTLLVGDSVSPSSVRCSMDSVYSKAAAAYARGMQIKIKGNCTGFNADELLGSDLILNRCVIE
jgi:hypothetical protein